MSSAKSPSAQAPRVKEPATLQTTRQMLDELDALMDRMLALPVNDIDDPVPAPRAIVRMPTMAATLTVMEPPPEAAEPEESITEPAVPLLRESFPSYRIEMAPAAAQPEADLPLMGPPAFQAPHFEVPEWEQAEVEAPAPLPTFVETEALPEEIIPRTVAELAVPARSVAPPIIELRPPRRPIASHVILPLLWFNQGFDKAIVVLGPLGRWLRGPRGRHLLGLTGLSLAAAAGIWLVKDWLGWTW